MLQFHAQTPRIVTNARLNPAYAARHLTSGVLRDETPDAIQMLAGFLASNGFGERLLELAEQLQPHQAAIVHQAVYRYSALH